MHGQQLRDLLQCLRSEVSDVDLHMLKTELHLLEMEATNLQSFRPRRIDRVA